MRWIILLALASLVAGCADSQADTEETTEPVAEAPRFQPVEVVATTLAFSGGAVDPVTEEFGLDHDGASAVTVAFDWEWAAGHVRLAVTDPAGTETELMETNAYYDGSPQLNVVGSWCSECQETFQYAPGEWTFTLDGAGQAAGELTVTVS